ncbi:MAG: hypothetical protein KC503_03310, partial [Myxococcales bacterium]|nr:hypothetical protein [Myxococcales bacterium]
MRSGRALSFFLALLINAALFAGSAYAVFRVLTARRPPGPSVKLGLPRQVAETALVFEWPTWWRFPLGTDGETLTYPPAEATDGADAAGVARRPKGKRRHAGRRKRRLAAGKVVGGGWRAAGGGSGSSAGSGSASGDGSDDGSDHGSDRGSGAAVTGSASGSDRGSAAGTAATGGSGSSNGSGSALSEGD